MKCEDPHYLIIKTIAGKNYRIHKNQAKDVLSLKKALSIQSNIPVNKLILIINLRIMRNDRQLPKYQADEQPYIVLASSDTPSQLPEIKEQKKHKQLGNVYTKYQRLQQQIHSRQQRIEQIQNEYLQSAQTYLRMIAQHRSLFIENYCKMGYPKQQILNVLKQAGNDVSLAQQYITDGIHQSKGKNLFTLLLNNQKKGNILKMFLMSPRWRQIQQRLLKVKDINTMYYIFQKITQIFPQILQFQNAVQTFSRILFGKSINFSYQKHFSKCNNPHCIHHHLVNHFHQ